jgi:ATP-binding cassette subfamily B protein
MLDNGSIVEQGRPADLSAENGKFAAFWQSKEY